jgi:hypothetical protein
VNRCISPAAALIAAFAWCISGSLAAADSPSRGLALKPVSAFASIGDERARSVALFTEAGKVIQSPRCLNCHPVTRQPTQGDDLHPHVPFMTAGQGDHGAAGLPCKSCHGGTNVTTLSPSIETIPGHPLWGLAPASMAWQGRSLGEICLQIKDLSRNGGRTLTAIHEHLSADPLVGWAWHPGAGRVPAPGTQAEFGELIEAWIATGAQCPAA